MQRVKGNWTIKGDVEGYDAKAFYRMNQAMTKLEKMKEDEYPSLLKVLFGLSSPSPITQDLNNFEGLEWVGDSLNDSQKQAVKFALASREVALIHGPPGVCLHLHGESRLLTALPRQARLTQSSSSSYRCSSSSYGF